MQTTEKRRFNRIQTSLPLSPTDRSDFPFCAIFDFSAGGLKLSCHPQALIQPGDIYSVTFSAHPEALPLHAKIRVVWTSADVDKKILTAGAKFEEISQQNQSILNYLSCKDRQFNSSENFCFYFMNLLRKNSLRSPVAQVRNISLPQDFLQKIEPYTKLTTRDELFYKCCYRAIAETTLSSVPSTSSEKLIQIKFMGFLFSVLLDDLLDEQKQIDLLEVLFKIPFADEPEPFLTSSTPKKELLISLSNLWKSFYDEVEQAPKFQTFQKIFQYDYSQHLNSMKYSLLLHHLPQANNVYEARTVLSHSTHMLVNANIDIMFSPSFDISQLGTIRHFIELAQYMCHIINWISSWKRELFNGDYTSGIFTYALDQKIISMDQLLDKKQRSAILEAIDKSNYKEYCFCLVDTARQELEICKNKIQTINMAHYIKGLENLLLMQMTYGF